MVSPFMCGRKVMLREGVGMAQLSKTGESISVCGEGNAEEGGRNGIAFQDH